MTRRVAALIPAAGSSTRMGLGFSKALHLLNGKTVIERTVSIIARIPGLERIIILVPDREYASFEKLFLGDKRIFCQVGGASRQESVKRGLDVLKSLPITEQPQFVVVHDGARCMLSEDLLYRCLEAGQEYGAATAAIPIVDSVVKIGVQFEINEYVPRENLMAVQTPQVFRFDLLCRAHADAGNTATDDASLVSRFHPVKTILGEKMNSKITTPEDLVAFEHLVRQSEKGG